MAITWWKTDILWIVLKHTERVEMKLEEFTEAKMAEENKWAESRSLPC